MEQAADKRCDKTVIDQREGRETGNGVKEEEEGTPRQSGKRGETICHDKRAKKENR